jgi:hypothetical protein
MMHYPCRCNGNPEAGDFRGYEVDLLKEVSRSFSSGLLMVQRSEAIIA